MIQSAKRTLFLGSLNASLIGSLYIDENIEANLAIAEIFQTGYVELCGMLLNINYIYWTKS